MRNLNKTFQGLLIFGLTLFSVSVFAEVAGLSPEVRAEEFSLSKKGLALGGYDPVAYFQDGPIKGSKALSHTHKGVTYYFASEANKVEFAANPSGYEPQYGGWCAWAMYDGGGRTEADPESFKIVDGKLYVFYKGIFGDTLAKWNELDNDEKLIGQADQNWTEQVFE